MRMHVVGSAYAPVPAGMRSPHYRPHKFSYTFPLKNGWRVRVVRRNCHYWDFSLWHFLNNGTRAEAVAFIFSVKKGEKSSLERSLSTKHLWVLLFILPSLFGVLHTIRAIFCNGFCEEKHAVKGIAKKRAGVWRFGRNNTESATLN